MLKLQPIGIKGVMNVWDVDEDLATSLYVGTVVVPSVTIDLDYFQATTVLKALWAAYTVAKTDPEMFQADQVKAIYDDLSAARQTLLCTHCKEIPKVTDLCLRCKRYRDRTGYLPTDDEIVRMNERMRGYGGN